MTKGIVLFFEQGFPMWMQHVTYEGNTIRGWVKDGHFWADYNSDTQILHVCTPRLGVIQWDAPINTMRKQVVKCTIAVPATLEASEPSEVVAWATQRKKIMNNQIKMLIEQATTRKQYTGPFGLQQVTEQFSKEKFAELIVLECAKILRKEKNSPEYSDLYSPVKTGITVSIAVIKDHFGVD